MRFLLRLGFILTDGLRNLTIFKNLGENFLLRQIETRQLKRFKRCPLVELHQGHLTGQGPWVKHRTHWRDYVLYLA